MKNHIKPFGNYIKESRQREMGSDSFTISLEELVTAWVSNERLMGKVLVSFDPMSTVDSLAGGGIEVIVDPSDRDLGQVEHTGFGYLFSNGRRIESDSDEDWGSESGY